MRKAIFSEEDIIKAGQALEKQLGRPVSAWEVFKEMGQRGKLSRFQEVWEAYAADISAEAVQEIMLPTDVETRLETALTALRDEFTNVLAGIVRELQEEHLRQSDLARRDHMNQESILLNKVESMSGELEFMRTRVKELEEEAEVATDTAVPSGEPAEPSASATARATVAKAAPRSLNLPVKKTLVKKTQVKKSTRPTAPRPKPAQKRAQVQA